MPVKIDPWVLTCLSPLSPEPAYLANPSVGVRIGRDGTGHGLPMFLSYEYGKDEKIQVQKSVLDFDWSFLKPQTSTDYRQALDMRTAVLTTTWSQSNLKVESETVLFPSDGLIGQRWSFQVPSGQTLRIPKPEVEFPETQNLGSQGNDWIAGPGSKASVAMVFHVGLTDYEFGFERLLKETEETWRNRWRTDIAIDGPPEDQQAIHSWMFYLESCAEGDVGDMAPYGLSGATYDGHIFWDADTWLFPALALIDPSAAKEVPDYRLAHVMQAEVAAKGSGIRFPWQSGVSGNELAPGNFNDEIHVTGDVAFMLDQAAALGLADPAKAQDVVNKAADFFYSRSTPSGGKRSILHIRSPDENRSSVDNDLYTNCLAQWTNDHSSSPKKIEYKLPSDSQSLITYDGDQVKGYKQAAAILAVYPLQDRRAVSQEKKMIARFPSRTTPFGPAMSRSIESIIWSRIGDPEAAYRAWRLSWMSYSGHPLMLFAEKPSNDDTYFQTGAAGCLQSVLYGFLGFGIDWQHNRQADWTLKLNNSHWLTIHPKLPKEWKSAQFRNFTIFGKRYTLTISPSRTTVTQGEP